MFLGNRNWGKKESLIPAVEVAHYSSCSKVTQRLPEGQAAKSFESDLPVPLPPHPDLQGANQSCRHDSVLVKGSLLLMSVHVAKKSWKQGK